MTRRPADSPTARRLALRHAGGLGLLLLGAATPLAAQTVYESRDKAGPVFSDQPSPGAKPVTIEPTNVIPATPAPPPASAPSATAAPATAYRSLVIAEPSNTGTLHSNTGAFEVRLRSSPGLRSSAGDRVRLTLDGNVLAGSYNTSRIRVTESDWQSAASGNVDHTLQAAIVDKSGQVLIESPPVVFYVHRATVGGRQNR